MWRKSKGRYHRFALAFTLSLVLAGPARAQIPPPPMPSPRFLDEFRGHQTRVNALAFSPAGRFLASAGGHGEKPQELDIWLWDVEKGERLTLLSGHGSTINSLVWSADGALLFSASGAKRSAIAGGDNTLRVWDVNPNSPRFGSELAQSAAPIGWLRGLTLSGADRYIAGARNGTQTVHIWRWRRVADGGVQLEELPPLRGHRESLHVVAFNADASLLFSGGADPWVGVWEVASGELLTRLRGFPAGFGQRVTAITLHPAGQQMAIADRSGEVRLYDLRAAPAAIPEIARLRGHRAGLTALTFSADGQTLFVATEAGRVWLWDVRGGEAPYRAFAILQEHEDIVMSLAQTGDLLAAAGGKGSGDIPQGDTAIRLWRLLDREEGEASP